MIQSIMAKVLASLLLLSSAAPQSTSKKVVTISQSGAEQTFRVPAYLVDSTRVGDLILGETTLEEALKMFPQSSGDYEGNPRAPHGFPPVKVGRKAPLPVQVYNPWKTMYALFFDENDKLVIIQDMDPPVKGLSEDEVVRSLIFFPELKETDRQEGFYEMQGEMSNEPCIVLLLMFHDITNTVTQSAYAFCCDTK
jgi:hypothetical protein